MMLPGDCTANSTDDRHQLLCTIWASFSDADRTFLVDRHLSLTNTPTKETESMNKEDDPESLPESKAQPPSTIASTGYKKSRLNNIVRQHTAEINLLRTQSLNTKSEKKERLSTIASTGYKKERLARLARQHSESAQQESIQHTTNNALRTQSLNTPKKRRLSTLIRKNSGRRLSTLLTMNTPQTTSSSSTRSKQLSRMNTTSSSTTSNEANLGDQLDESQQDNIVYHILTQQMILEHAIRDGGYHGYLMTRVFPYFSPQPVSQRAKIMEILIMILVCLNVAVVVISTEVDYFATSQTFEIFEIFSFITFSVEYVLRLWVCVLDEKYAKDGPVLGRLKYILSYNALIDLIALIPSLIEWSSKNGPTGVGTGLRLWRVVRIMKLEHYSKAFATLRGGFDQQGNLWRLVLIYPCVALILFSTLLSFTETLSNGASVETAIHFSSIPRAMFPTLLMLSGEAPLLDFTPGGQVIVSCLSIFSLVIMATATGILASGFETAMRQTKEASTALDHTRRALRRHIKNEAKSQNVELNQNRTLM
jgi:voltage-gated potassium channel